MIPDFKTSDMLPDDLSLASCLSGVVDPLPASPSEIRSVDEVCCGGWGPPTLLKTIPGGRVTPPPPNPLGLTSGALMVSMAVRDVTLEASESLRGGRETS